MKRTLGGMAAATAALALAIVSAGTSLASPRIPAERRIIPYSGDLPTCDDPGVLSRIQDRFAQKESEYWNSALLIVGYDHIGQTGLRSTGPDFIPRRYCTARASINDDHHREVIYWIGEDLGIIGFGYKVEWCVVGLDRNWAYGPACRAARP